MREKAKKKIDFLAEVLKKRNRVNIIGHTDSVGKAEYNEWLSERRAYAVYSYIKELGVSISMVTYGGLGESTPIASNETEKGRHLNRRVEIDIAADDIGFLEKMANGIEESPWLIILAFASSIVTLLIIEKVVIFRLARGVRS